MRCIDMNTYSKDSNVCTVESLSSRVYIDIHDDLKELYNASSSDVMSMYMYIADKIERNKYILNVGDYEALIDKLDFIIEYIHGIIV